MTYTALGASIPAVFITWFMPNHELPYVLPQTSDLGDNILTGTLAIRDKNNLVEE